jgi:diguanylate cyclase (GGDEF)-like protein/PAS domain S-box-containing protein
MENASIDIYWLDSNAKIHYANNLACKKLGYTKEELYQLYISDIDPNFLANLWPEYWRQLKIDKSQSYETLHKSKDGEIFPVEVTANYVNYDGHEFTVGFAKDITERKQAEARLRESEFLLKYAIEGAGEGVWDWDIQLDTTNFSKRWREIFGYSEQDFVPSSNELRNLFHPDDQAKVSTAMQTYLEGGSEYYAIECRMRCKDGRYKWVLGRGMVVNRSSDGHPLRMIGTTTDISERKQAEFALQASQEQLLMVLEGAELGFWDWDILSGKVNRNERWANMLGYTNEETQNTTQQWTDFIHPEDRQKAWQSVADVIAGNSLAHKLEYRMLHKDGSIRWIFDQAKVMKRDVSGKPTRMSGTHIDITERKKVEELMGENSLRLKRILDNLFAYVALLDTNGVVQEVNKAPLERAGYRHEDVVGQYFFDAPWWNYDNAVREKLVVAINAAKQGTSSRYDVVVKMGDDLVPIDFQITPVYDNYGQIVGLLPTAVDITDRKRLEAELQRQANFDYLTGLPNRRSFMDRGKVELSRTQRYGSDLSILMLDIDLFKKINDAHGHQAGDLVLKSMSITFQEVLRNVDIVGRLGGEEFAAVLPETGIEKAVEVAERLREVISLGEVTLADGNKIHFTVSIGVTSLIKENSNIEGLLNEADKALYRAKQAGRNRVST